MRVIVQALNLVEGHIWYEVYEGEDTDEDHDDD